MTTTDDLLRCAHSWLETQYQTATPYRRGLFELANVDPDAGIEVHLYLRSGIASASAGDEGGYIEIAHGHGVQLEPEALDVEPYVDDGEAPPFEYMQPEGEA